MGITAEAPRADRCDRGASPGVRRASPSEATSDLETGGAGCARLTTALLEWTTGLRRSRSESSGYLKLTAVLAASRGGAVSQRGARLHVAAVRIGTQGRASGLIEKDGLKTESHYRNLGKRSTAGQAGTASSVERTWRWRSPHMGGTSDSWR